AVGVLQPKDSCELHDLPMLVKVACKKRDDTDELTNVVKGYKKRDSGIVAPVAAPTSAPAKAASNPTTPPWKRT
ncbi:MAG: hypothetical protein Q8K78_11280, partial [Planctomycetaceae bacterium]|nr:hypothetical protein [Planctomycetaceae bacterium]